MKLKITQLTKIFGIGLMTTAFVLVLQAKPVQASIATGTITSAIKDTGGLVNFNLISWSASTSASSTITIKVRTATTSDMSTATAWASCNDVTNNSDISSNNCVTDGQRYFQYQATFTTDYATTSEFVSAELYSVDIGYNVMATLISSPYNSTVSDNVISQIQWSETKPGSTDVVFQIRTSPNGTSSWSSWLGPTGTSDYYTDPGGGETINSTHSDGSSDKYFQYKLFLVSDGTNLPVLSDVTIDYDASIPIITSISPTSATTATSSNTITINGSGFLSGATVAFTNDLNQTATGTVTASTSAQITCTVSFANMPGGRYTVTVTNTNGGVDSLENAFYIETTTGSLTSAIKDFGQGVDFGLINWTATTSATSTITMKLRSSSDAAMSGAPDWSTCNEVSNNSLITTSSCVTNGQRYLQYQAIFTTTYATSSVFATPELGDVNIGYNYYASSSLISNYYDTEEIRNVINSLVWNETVPGSSDVCIQIRTSPGEGGSPTSWSDWLGVTGTDTCYTAPTGSSIYSGQRDGYDDRWVQYKATLIPDGINVPILSDLEIIYVTSTTTPMVVTSPIAWTGAGTAKGLGRVSDNGSGPIARVGFEYGLTATNTWSVSKDVYLNNDAFDVVLTGLSKDTKYYFRAFAVNARGTSTGDTWEEFTTKASTTLQTMILKTRTILKSNVMLR